MCGYYLDAYNEDIPVKYLINQFDYAFSNKLNEIRKDSDNFVFKLSHSSIVVNKKAPF